jgi:hypothetical protein
VTVTCDGKSSSSLLRRNSDGAERRLLRRLGRTRSNLDKALDSVELSLLGTQLGLDLMLRLIKEAHRKDTLP